MSDMPRIISQMKMESKTVYLQFSLQIILPMHILNERATHIEQYYEGFVSMECMATMHVAFKLQIYVLHAIKASALVLDLRRRY